MISKFVREYRSFYFCYGVLSISFIVLFYLYRLPQQFLTYTIIVSISLLIIMTIGWYYKFYSRMKALEYYIHEEALYLLNKPIDLAYLALIEKERQDTREQLLVYKSKEEDLQAIVKMWSHQMKVPLAALSLMSQTGNLNDKDVNHQLLRLDNYLANLLNYLKLTSYSSDFRFEKVDVRAIVVDIIKKYRHEFLQKDITVTITGEWIIKTDRKWLNFALSQVIDNAIKYNKIGGKVSILFNNSIQICDTGIGIFAQDIPRLFEEGFTGYNGREHQKATGFGLYLTKRILTPLNLTIKVESEVDKGTCVYILR